MNKCRVFSLPAIQMSCVNSTGVKDRLMVAGDLGVTVARGAL